MYRSYDNEINHQIFTLDNSKPTFGRDR